MQNMDFYDGRNVKNIQPQMNRNDREFYAGTSNSSIKEDIRNKKRASRIIFLITALCIVTFTTGIAIGIKFAGGNERKIVDDQTFKAVADISSKVSNIFNNKNTNKFKNVAFPKEKYPYVIKVGKKFNKKISQKIAKSLSSMGHTVIISQKNNKYLVYTGPYKNFEIASISAEKFAGYSELLENSNIKILKRQ